MRIYPQITPNLFRSDFPHLFRWSKQGIILKNPREWINLDSLWRENSYMVWELIDGLMEQELTRGQKEEVREVYEYFIKLN